MISLVTGITKYAVKVNDPRDIRYCLEKALLLAPRGWFIAWLAARIRCYYHQFALALKLLQQAMEWNAAEFALWLELGRCQQALGLVGAAKHSLLQARELSPDSREANQALASLSSAGLGSRLRGLWRRVFAK